MTTRRHDESQAQDEKPADRDSQERKATAVAVQTGEGYTGAAERGGAGGR
jgi:hypothetical protein